MLLLANVQLQRRVKEERALYEAVEAGLAPHAGLTVPPLEGYDINGKRVDFEYGRDGRKTLILALSPSCHACDDNWKNWQKLLTHTNPDTERVVFVDVATNEPPLTQSYVTQHQISSLPLITQVSAESSLAYHFQYTPQTILVDAQGRILKVKTGQLDSDSFFATTAAKVGTSEIRAHTVLESRPEISTLLHIEVSKENGGSATPAAPINPKEKTNE